MFTFRLDRRGDEIAVGRRKGGVVGALGQRDGDRQEGPGGSTPSSAGGWEGGLESHYLRLSPPLEAQFTVSNAALAFQFET